ncbi:GAF and ANTAR domain-containing protein [Isoptericola sp. S6320L]|uniref:GAF and ANTAR domain-containing protein n=1 Tax=Isoptericola sp. S6320L TaxID=2926411 RepID=UPI001FF47D80|nr:GAF and ANTAR domain-containing protein [Isoptericola sp. S6320L]MCK0115702.1 GAF and ANTAR domain-containing protein [Isoptericola sp. S6320L]
MTPQEPTDTLAGAASALVHGHDVTDLLLRLTQQATRTFGGDVGGLLVRADRAGRLEVLAATDHLASHLEVYQAQRVEGPCVDVVVTGAPVAAVGREELLERWPAVGREIVDAGLRSVHAFPLAWRGAVVGGLNIFARHDLEATPETARAAQAVADMLTLVVTQPDTLGEDELARRIDHALAGRVVIEQAKGALAERLDLDMARAYDALVERSLRTGTTVTETARSVLQEAQEG